MTDTTTHTSAVLTGAKATLIMGPSGAGKSRLVFDLLRAAEAGMLAFARLVADDRALLEACHGRLLVRPAPALAGKMEIRGLGILQFPYEPVAVAGLVVTLDDPSAERIPERRIIEIKGILLPHLAVGPGVDPLPLVLAQAGILGCREH